MEGPDHTKDSGLVSTTKASNRSLDQKIVQALNAFVISIVALHGVHPGCKRIVGHLPCQEKGFHNWLEGARDWAVSGSRFWCTPLPVWISQDGEEIIVMDSIEKLERLSGLDQTRGWYLGWEHAARNS